MDMTVELWYVDLDDLARRPDLLSAVTAGDREMAGRLRTDVLRGRFLGRRAATRHVLGLRLGLTASELEIVRRCWRCGSSDHGRPSLIDAPCDFSVSASGGTAVIAVADHRVGVDLEVVPPAGSASMIIPGRALTTGESVLVASLSPPDQERMFLRMWAIKEAVLKAEGSGLSIEPNLVDTTAVATNSVGQVSLAGHRWSVRTIAPPGAAKDDVVVALAGSEELLMLWRSVPW
jgi:4'-phosphopantetheinyl transferase